MARDDPFSHLTSHAMQAQAHHARYGAAKLEEAGTSSEFVTRTIKKVLDEETARLENGLTVLATVGATAPFVGLFGTVWGVYHALVAIGMSGPGTLDKVAGPVGEALIMTGLGLAVAIPAVRRLQRLTRANRVLLAQARRLRATTCSPSSRWASRSARSAGDDAGARTCARSPVAAGGGLRSAPWLSAASTTTGASAPMAEINMVPLIDVMLVLLVIFIITAPLLTHAVKLELPKASLAGQRPQAGEDRVRDRRRGRCSTGTARRCRAPTARRASPPRARSRCSPRSICAPTRASPIASSRRPWPTRRRRA